MFLQIGLKFWKFDFKVVRKFLFQRFRHLKNRQIGFQAVFEGHARLLNTVMIYFSQIIKILYKTIIIVLEGLKFIFQCSGRSHTLETLFLPKIVLSQNRVLLVKCVHLVYKMIIYVLNICLFLLMFSDMIHTYENVKKQTIGFQ